MAYDFHGPWAIEGPTGHHANLYLPSDEEEEGTLSADGAVRRYLAQGVPPGKLVLGVPFYGHGWAGVQAEENGLGQPATGLARGTYAVGSDSYGNLTRRDLPFFYDEQSKASWLYDGEEFWTVDDPLTLSAKRRYTVEQGLRGIMFWELSGDDENGTLIGALSGRAQ